MNTETGNVYTMPGTAIADTDRLREAFQATPPRGQPSENCPKPEKLWAAVRMELPRAERRGIVDHTATCASCAEDWRIAWRLATEEKQTAESARVVPGPWRRHLPQLSAAAALLAVAVGTGLVLQRPDSVGYRGAGSAVEPARSQMSPVSEPQVFRGGAAPETGQSLLPPNAVLSRQDAVLRWVEGAQGSRYEVRVMTGSLETVAVGRDLAEPAFTVPEEALEGLEPGATLHWQVVAFPPEGSVTTSATFTTVIE